MITRGEQNMTSNPRKELLDEYGFHPYLKDKEEVVENHSKVSGGELGRWSGNLVVTSSK